MSYSKEDLKENIDYDDVFLLLDTLGAEPVDKGDYIVAKTICHCGSTNKLYFYNNSDYFQCYTQCGTFDVIELIQKVKGLDFNAAIYFLVNFFNLQWKIDDKDDAEYNQEDWKIFDRQEELRAKARELEKFQFVELPEYDKSILTYYPQPIIADWQDTGITKEVCDIMNIRYDPVELSVLIPHYDDNSRLVGIRRRTLVEEEEAWGKYRPWRNGHTQYNHPLSFNLYGLDIAKHNIQRCGTVVVYEAEKSVLNHISQFGIENDIAVAVCGSTFSKYQFELLRYYGAKEIIIAFDKDYHSLDDVENYEAFEKKMKKLGNKFNAQCNLSFLVDGEKNLLGYKDSPIDRGKEIFLDLFKDRRYLR